VEFLQSIAEIESDYERGIRSLANVPRKESRGVEALVVAPDRGIEIDGMSSAFAQTARP